MLKWLMSAWTWLRWRVGCVTDKEMWALLEEEENRRKLAEGHAAYLAASMRMLHDAALDNHMKATRENRARINDTAILLMMTGGSLTVPKEVIESVEGYPGTVRIDIDDKGSEVVVTAVFVPPGAEEQPTEPQQDAQPEAEFEQDEE